MAMQSNSPLLNSDLQSWYTSFNDFITSSKCGGTIAVLSVPANNKKAEASDINNLDAKITAFQQDEYLGTQVSWWPNAHVNIGDLISPLPNLTTVISNFSQVICRNLATNNKGQNTNQCDANGNHGECCNTNSTNANCCNTNSTNSNCCNTNSTNANCCNTNGNHGNCCNTNGNNGNCCNTNGNNGNYCANQVFTYYVGKVWQRNGSTARPGKYYGNNYAGTGVVWTPQGGTTPCQNNCGTETGGTNVREYQSMRSCNVTCSYQTHSQGCGNSTHGQGCGNSTHGQACGNGNHGQGCGRGNHGQGCQRGNHGEGCNRGQNTNSCSQGNNSQTCSNTTTIDITCNQATKSNT